MHHSVLQLGKSFATQPAHRGPQATAKRSRCVVAKVVMVEVINGIDEQPQFDIEFLGLRRVPAVYFGIHTRTSDKSFSTSRGFAM